MKLRPVGVAELASSCLPSDNGGSYRRTAETLIVGAPLVSEGLKYLATVDLEPPPFGVAIIENAIVGGEGLIWKKIADGVSIAAETLMHAHTPRSVQPLQRDADGSLYVDPDLPRKRLPSQYTYAFLRQTRDNNYGHWLTEVLPKVAILADHFDIKELRFIVTRHFPMRESRPMRKIYFESLGAFGIAPHQIVEMTRDAVAVDRLLYPLPLSTGPVIKSLRMIDILERLGETLRSRSRGPRRLYVSRKGAQKRHLINEPEVLRVLKDFDIKVIHAVQRLSFVDQVRLFADAELVVGNYGANLANVAFAKRGVKVLALTTPGMHDDFFWDLTNLKCGAYYSLHGEAVSVPANMDSDFRIDPAQLRHLLEGPVLGTR